MAQADPEHRDSTDELPHGRRLLDERLGVTGAVREHDSVEPGERVGIDIVGEDRDRHSGRGEPAEDRALRAVVDDRDPSLSPAEKR